MSTLVSGSKINRRSGRVSLYLGTGLMVGPSVLLLLAALHTPKLPPLASALIIPEPTWEAEVAKSSACSGLALPHDASLENAGGDPYAFYEFNRDETLAGLRREVDRCFSSAGAALR